VVQQFGKVVNILVFTVYLKLQTYCNNCTQRADWRS